MTITAETAPAAWEEAVENLELLDRCLDPSISKHERVDSLIAEAIHLGLDTKTAIVDALEAIGRNPVHVRIRLGKNAKLHPDRRPWFRDKDRRYHIQDG